jgi:hypothetical protein
MPAALEEGMSGKHQGSTYRDIRMIRVQTALQECRRYR